MTTIDHGADADELDRLVAQIEQGATTLDGVYAPIRGAFLRSGWEGPDADHFAGEWDGPARKRLASTSTGLREAARALRHNAAEQRQASATGGQSAGGLAGMDPGGPPGRGFPGFGPDGLRWANPVGGHSVDDLRDGLSQSSGGNLAFGYGVGGLGLGAAGAALLGWSGSSAGAFGRGPLHASGKVDGMAGLAGSADASARLGPDGLDASVRAEGFAGLRGSVSGNADLGLVHGAVTGSAMLGAEAALAASAHMGLDGASLKAKAGGFAGVSAEGSASAGISGGTVTTTGGVQAGVGLSAQADVSAGWHDTHIEVGGNVALGLGVTGGIDVHVDPSKIASDTYDGARIAYQWAEDGLSHLPEPHWPW